MNGIFTVIICSYNSSSRIESIVERVVNQAEYKTLVREIILVNNNSSDDTSFWMKRCRDKYDNVRVVFEPKPGLSNARKKGILETNSEWIIFIDDDNYLSDTWITSANEYIKKYPKVGAFNGVVIPKFESEISEEQEKIVRSSLKVLACTHMKLEEVIDNRSTFRNPIGAGLVIKTEPLKQLCNNGWLKCMGRNAKNLGSGEDGEMCMYVKNNGYDFGFNNEMVIQHLLPSFRLEKEYLEKLWAAISIGVSDVIKGQKRHQIKGIIYYLLINIRLFIKKFNKNKYEYYFYRIYVREFKNKFFF